MDFKVGGPSGPKATDKKKSTSSSTASGSTSFASMLEQAEQANEPAATSSTFGVMPQVVLGVEEQPVQPDARERGKQLLKQLEDLTQDVLAGQPSAALHKLKETLATQPANTPLSAEQQQALDDLATRAAVEVAKLEESK